MIAPKKTGRISGYRDDFVMIFRSFRQAGIEPGQGVSTFLGSLHPMEKQGYIYGGIISCESMA